MPKDNQDNRGDAQLDVRSLTKRYAGRTVLDAVNLRIEPDEFVAIVGRSGCAKSTLLRVIAGLELPDAGQVKLGGNGHNPETRMMFQDARMLPWKTVLQNVALGLKDGAERARTALRSMTRVELKVSRRVQR